MQTVSGRGNRKSEQFVPECPICGFAIKGDAFSGYRCVKCHAHYRPQYIRRLRKAEIREHLERHFGKKAAPAIPPAPVQHASDGASITIDHKQLSPDTDRISIAIDLAPKEEVTATLQETAASARASTERLEALLSLGATIVGANKMVSETEEQDTQRPLPVKRAPLPTRKNFPLTKKTPAKTALPTRVVQKAKTAQKDILTRRPRRHAARTQKTKDPVRKQTKKTRKKKR
jgi:hypothetical protein